MPSRFTPGIPSGNPVREINGSGNFKSNTVAAAWSVVAVS